MINLSLAQINPTVGDLEGNLRKIKDVIENYSRFSHIILFPELAISGYSPEDLLLRIDFIKACERALEDLISFSKDHECLIGVGLPLWDGDVFNALALIFKGDLVGYYKKARLPNYGVFDEVRYFREGEEPLIVEVNGYKIGFSICEDIWYPDHVERLTLLSGAELLLNVNASVFHEGKQEFREGFVRSRAQDNICYVAYLNLVGGQDEIVFDGRSMVIDPLGRVVARAKAFEEDILTVSLNLEEVRRRRLLDLRWRFASKEIDPFPPIGKLKIKAEGRFEGRMENSPQSEEELYKAIVLATKDYVEKNNFSGAVLGLSGGIDSALTACIAVDALGRERVKALFMPSRFSSKESYEDAKALAENLGIDLIVISIDEIFAVYRKIFEETLGIQDFSVADENLQARIRANLLFYISNRENLVVLSTSNKSESAVGYTTIYGDMAGGFAPIKDLFKTQVYALARYRNSIKEVIPERIFKKPPTAELRPNQKDQDTLPPYDLLDALLKPFIEENAPLSEIEVLPEEEKIRVANMVRKAEYKRKQAPIGPKVTGRAFGKDWRMPITNKFTFKVT